MGINQIINKDIHIDEEKYMLEPLGKELITEFDARGISTDDFFIDLDNMLVPASGLKFETMNWHLSAQIARKYNVKPYILYVGANLKKINPVKAVFEEYGVSYEVIHKSGNNVPKAIIEAYHEGNYQLVTLGSRRTKGFIERLLNTSVSKHVVDNVGSAVLQVHPPAYGQTDIDISKIFMLFDGSERDFYLARWARILSSVGQPKKIFAYNIVTIPQTISLEDAAKFPEIKRSASKFNDYAKELSQRLNLEAEPTLLYGHNFVKSLVLATEKHEPEVVLIGHTKDTGLWNQIRTRLAYRIMRNVDSAVIVHHMPGEIKKT